jgi:hypothetical protein
MNYVKLNLIAPNHLPIVGVKLTDNRTAEFKCFYDKESHSQDWEIPNSTFQDDNCFVFIDSSGSEWKLNPSDVVLDSLVNNPSCMS